MYTPYLASGMYLLKLINCHPISYAPLSYSQFTSPDQVTEKAPSGCYISGLYLEGGRWDLQNGCLAKSLPKVLVEDLPILRVIPIEAHRLKLVVSLLWHTYYCS